MLNTLTLMKELQRSVPSVITQQADQRKLLKELFVWLQNHPEQFNSVQKQNVPTWQGAFDTSVEVQPQPHPYSVLAVDGSQIYPDKHQGITCYVLNTGIAQFSYGEQGSQVHLESIPQVVTQSDATNLSEDMVNCHRAELEFKEGLRVSQKGTDLFLCDGSLIFWHLENKPKALRDRFLKSYLELLEQFYQARIPIAGYISLPKSRELITMLKQVKKDPLQNRSFDMMVDTDLVDLFLPKGHRTTVFSHTSVLADEYPDSSKPHFVYLHTEHEIARVELPAWIVQNDTLLTKVLQIITDQSLKGNGYPVSLSEAHEQAVIKNHERTVFFQMLSKITASEQSFRPSQKSLKKRFVSV